MLFHSSAHRFVLFFIEGSQFCSFSAVTSGYVYNLKIIYSKGMLLTADISIKRMDYFDKQGGDYDRI